MAQTGIFDTPANTDSTSGFYQSASALFAATREGVNMDLLRRNESAYQRGMSKSVYLILQREYGMKKDRVHGIESENSFGFLMAALTNYEFETDKKRFAEIAKDNENQAFGKAGDPYNPTFEDSRMIFRKFAGQYTAAVKEYIARKQQEEEQRQTELAEQRRLADLQARKTAEERRQQKERVDAREASQQAEDDIKAAAVASALEKAKKVREQKLADTLASSAYKMWEAALQVQQGEEMISKAQHVLNYDDAVSKQSGVTDLLARRKAGEQIVVGKSMIESSFAAYKKLGGKAAIPNDVVPGPDPAADYR